ncbi:MAG: hypothetical protein ABR592_03295 [Nitriliruptorales bacterium]
MTYFRDLTPYNYGRTPWRMKVLNVGWLTAGEPFPTGDVPTLFVERLLEHCATAIRRTRGFHVCDLCLAAGASWGPIRVVHDGRDLLLGSAEVWVGGLPGQGRVWYAAPDLVYHYVTAHQYRPPDPFIEAVLQGKRYRG